MEEKEKREVRLPLSSLSSLGGGRIRTCKGKVRGRRREKPDEKRGSFPFISERKRKGRKRESKLKKRIHTFSSSSAIATRRKPPTPSLLLLWEKKTTPGGEEKKKS